MELLNRFFGEQLLSQTKIVKITRIYLVFKYILELFVRFCIVYQTFSKKKIIIYMFFGRKYFYGDQHLTQRDTPGWHIYMP